MISIRELKHIDYLLLLSVILLLVSGWFVMYSASYQERLSTGIDYPQKQLIWMTVAILFFFSMLFIDYHFLLNISFILYAVVICLLILVLTIGESRFGARRWIGVGGFTLQPGEFAKICVILAITKYLVWDIEKRQTLRYIIICGLILFLPLFLIFKQPDLGTTLIFIPTVFVMLFTCGMRWSYIIGSGITWVLATPLIWTLLKGYQKKRLFAFLNPELDPYGAGYSLIQSKIAIGSGGIFGKGWLSGTQNRLNFIPERHTDFIFSVIGEEWGFLGAIAVLLLFFVIIACGFNIAKKAPDISGRLLAIGLTTMFGIQVGVNIGMTIGLVPVTGIPLPFISYGGTSLVVTMGMMGLLENVYMRRFMF